MIRVKAFTLLMLIGGCLIIAAAPPIMRAAGDVGTATALVLPDSPQNTHPLLTGTAPRHLELTTIDGKIFSLDKAIRDKPTILIFYRGGWCPYCNAHLAAVEQIEPELMRLGYQILAISPDPGPKLQEMVDKHSLTYTLLSDRTMKVSAAFGLAYRVDDAMNAKLQSLGIDLALRTGLNPPLLPVPAAYVLDTKGHIHFAYANPDFRTRVDPQSLLKAAEDAVKRTSR